MYTDSLCGQASHNLLGLPAIKALQVLTLVNEIEVFIPDQYSFVLPGLGTFQDAYEIKLKPGVQPNPVYSWKCSTPIEEGAGGVNTYGISWSHYKGDGANCMKVILTV